MFGTFSLNYLQAPNMFNSEHVQHLAFELFLRLNIVQNLVAELQTEQNCSEHHALVTTKVNNNLKYIMGFLVSTKKVKIV